MLASRMDELLQNIVDSLPGMNLDGPLPNTGKIMQTHPPPTPPIALNGSGSRGCDLFAASNLHQMSTGAARRHTGQQSAERRAQSPVARSVFEQTLDEATGMCLSVIQLLLWNKKSTAGRRFNW